MNTWVLLRGLIREQRHWGDFPTEFQREIHGSNIVTLDLPGNGVMHHAASPLRIEDMARHCRNELESRGLAPPYYLLALSLGAMVAVSWCMQSPGEIAGCVLINTSLRPFSPFYRRLRPGNYPRLLWAAAHGDVARREKLILQLTSNRADTQARLVERWTAWQNQYPTSRANALRQLLAAMRFRAPRHKPSVPILVLGSERDRLVNADCSHRLASAWHAEAVFHPDAGHDLPLDDGPWVARQVGLWLNGGKIGDKIGGEQASEVIIATTQNPRQP
ncbi:MAG: alpha/beta hydrolase [Burkholderiaceae bacterium]|nr:alpha/beta hydrolase [Burkholderiaceae bacterium]